MWFQCNATTNEGFERINRMECGHTIIRPLKPKEQSSELENHSVQKHHRDRIPEFEPYGKILLYSKP